MSLLSDSLAFHAARLHESAGEIVTYIRGSTSWTGINATRGQTRFEEIPSEMGVVVQTRTSDWLIEPSQLVTGSTQIYPDRGDKVVDSDGNTYDVLPGADDKHWQYTDQHETFFRIHSVKRV